MSNPRPPSADLVPGDQLLYLEVEADDCPQALLRVLGLIAQLGLVAPTIRAELHVRGQHILIGLKAPDDHVAEMLLAKIEAIVAVDRARYRPFI